MRTYEEQLDRDLGWAFREGSMHFEKESAVHRTLRQIAERLDEFGIDYAIAGGMALFAHGVRRFTEDVDILVTREGLAAIHQQLEGRGYLSPFQQSKNLRDTNSGVRIKFLVAGDYPGDGKPKPVSFPNPADARIELDGVAFLSLPKLVELKLASGMTNPRRLQDLADVQKLIEELRLPLDFSDQLNPFVHDKYRELWESVVRNPQPDE